jgi:uncharacterized membrane protein (DUF106 family)
MRSRMKNTRSKMSKMRIKKKLKSLRKINHTQKRIGACPNLTKT